VRSGDREGRFAKKREGPAFCQLAKRSDFLSEPIDMKALVSPRLFDNRLGNWQTGHGFTAIEKTASDQTCLWQFLGLFSHNAKSGIRGLTHGHPR
jgi:hypothetical protein